MNEQGPSLKKGGVISMESIIVLNPTAVYRTHELKMAPRPGSLEGKVLGILWNNKSNGDILLKRFSELINERFHLAHVIMRKKPLSSSAATEDILNELSSKCDLVITATGD